MAIVTDSACDLPPSASRGVRVVPLTIAFGTEAYRDGVDLPAESFWEKLGAAPDLPTTASPSPEALRAAYREAAEDGARGVVSIHVSGALSRTVESARAAADDAPVPVEVVDSRSVSLGQALLVLAAARTAAAGGTIEAVHESARSARDRLEIYALLETVDFLKRGGRVGRAKAALTDLLRIRPIMTLRDGEPALVARPRTRRRAIDEVLERTRGPAEAAAVLHAGAPEAESVAESVAASTGVEPLLGLIGGVTGTHLGPAALGVAVLRPSGSPAPP